jgi:hypothetical protein
MVVMGVRDGPLRQSPCRKSRKGSGMPRAKKRCRRTAWSVLPIALILLAATPALAQLENLLRLPRSGADLSDAKIGDGLKQALQVGTENAVGLTGKVDGYFANAAIKILMPDRLRTVEQGLRMMGQGAQIDEFVLSMNRAAERAAPAAKSIFWNAIGAMTLEDARRFLQGSNTAATEYF